MPRGECPIHKRKGFLFIGRFIPNKGIRLLLDAYQRLSPNPDIWPLTLVGDGPLRDEVLKLISDKLIKGVRLTGFVSEEERHRHTRNAKWMVTPPHTNEDLGLTPLEARSVGVPCIASNDGGVTETAGKHALFCKRGCVKSLQNCLQEAVEMCESEYKQKVLATKEGLQDYVRPLDEYAKLFAAITSRLKKSERIELIDLLRGLSCLGVLLYHIRIDLWIGWKRITNYPNEYTSIEKSLAWLAIPAPFLGYAILLFFLISGFCIHYPNTLSNASPSWKVYFQRRFWRIYPSYLSAILLTAVISYICHIKWGDVDWSFERIFRVITVSQNYPPGNGQFLTNPSLWTIPLKLNSIFYIRWHFFLS